MEVVMPQAENQYHDQASTKSLCPAAQVSTISWRSIIRRDSPDTAGEVAVEPEQPQKAQKTTLESVAKILIVRPETTDCTVASPQTKGMF